MASNGKGGTALGCFFLILWAGWIAFVIWAIVTVINWLVTK